MFVFKYDLLLVLNDQILLINLYFHQFLQFLCHPVFIIIFKLIKISRYILHQVFSINRNPALHVTHTYDHNLTHLFICLIINYYNLIISIDFFLLINCLMYTFTACNFCPIAVDYSCVLIVCYRLCHNSAGNECQHGGDAASAACWIGKKGFETLLSS